jgi:hypothetical protein
MLIVALVFIFFALLAVAYELHTITDRLIEIGTIVEHANRRVLRASLGEHEDDYADDSITKVHKKWALMVGGIVLAAVVTVAILAGVGLIPLR